MGNKKDMYINYERSYKKNRRRGNKKWGLVIIIAIVILGLSFAAFYVITTKINIENTQDQSTQAETLGENPSSNNEDQTEVVQNNQNLAEQLIDLQVNNQPTPQVTVAPTPTVTILKELETTAVEEKDPRISAKVKGIYVTAPVAGSDLIDELVELVDKTEINTMVIDIKDDLGKISYTMDSTVAQEIGAVSNTISDMKTLITTLKEKNIYLIARIVAFKDPYLAEKRQDLAIKNQDGSLYRDNNGEGWVNPYNRQVWDYLIEIATHAAAIGFDEIQFDYIRFSTGGGINKADFGEEAKTKGKEDIIIEFTKYAYEQIKPLGVFVSADVYGTIISSSIDAGLVGQNFVEMSKYLDYICPMIYPSHFGEGNYGIEYPDKEPFEIIRKVLTASKTKLDLIPVGEHKAIVRPWLQDFTASWIKHYIEYGGPEVREQISGVYGAGYEEWLLWNAGCNYSEEGLLKE